MGLDFIGIVWERFDLAIPQRFMEAPGMRALLDVLRGAAFKRALGAQSGYRSQETGRLAEL